MKNMRPIVINSNELKENNYGQTRVVDILNKKNIKFSVAKVRKIGNDIKAGYDLYSDVAYYVLEGELPKYMDWRETLHQNLVMEEDW